MPGKVCDHAGRLRCVPNCRHANPKHRIEHYAACRCDDSGECCLNPRYRRTYARVRCVPVRRK
jgi:hypothetical protein